MPFMALEEWLEGATYPFTIKTCSTSKQPNASTHLKPSGPCSSPGLSSPSPTSWIPKTDWVHTTLATGHPQTLRTIHHLLWAKFWWPHVTQLTLLSVLLLCLCPSKGSSHLTSEKTGATAHTTMTLVPLALSLTSQNPATISHIDTPNHYISFPCLGYPQPSPRQSSCSTICLLYYILAYQKI